LRFVEERKMSHVTSRVRVRVRVTLTRKT